MINFDKTIFSDTLVEWPSGLEMFVNDKKTPFKFPECPQCETTLKKIVGKKLILTCPPYFRFICSNCDFDNFVKMKFKENCDQALNQFDEINNNR